MSVLRPTILVVEDDPNIRRFVRLALEGAGYAVHEAGTLQRGLVDAGTRQPALVILDLGLPDGDGLQLLRDLRCWSAVPVLVLSARGAEADKVQALDGGADDFLAKPFGIDELLARVRAHLRRHAGGASAPSPVLAFDDVVLDLERRVVTRGGATVHLTPIEFRLLAYLASRPDRVLTHQQLLRDLWGPGYVEHTHYVRVFMASLRKKLEADPARPRHLLTETGVGYRFRLEPD